MQGAESWELESGLKLVRLALANYRGDNLSLPDAERVESMLLLIRIANADAATLQWAAQSTGEPAEDLQRSAIAFIEHSFFAPGKDHFAVLGLNPWANATDIKEHYRLLMRVFHPDKNHVAPAQAARYSAMINQAYAALKIAVPQTPESIQAHMLAQQKLVRTHSLPKPKFGQHLALSWLSRQPWLTPTKIMLSVIAVAGLFVALTLHSFNSNTVSTYDVLIGDRMLMDNLEHDAANQPNQIVESALSLAAESEAEASNAAAKMPDANEINSRIKLSAALTPKVLGAPHREPIAAVKGVEASALHMAPTLAKPASKPSVAAVNAQPARATAKSLSANNTIADVKLSSGTATLQVENKLPLSSDNNIGSAEKSVQMLPAGLVNSVSTNRVNAAVNQTKNLASVQEKVVSNLPNDYELRGLIAHFTDSYQRGDIQAFMLLFSDDVDAIEEGGRLGLQDTYGNFFDNTQSRAMMIRDLSWKQNGNVFAGIADYHTVVLRKNANVSFQSAGSFKFKVAKANGSIKIVGFHHLSNAN